MTERQSGGKVRIEYVYFNTGGIGVQSEKADLPFFLFYCGSKVRMNTKHSAVTI